jgi:hypothetical protein
LNDDSVDEEMGGRGQPGGSGQPGSRRKGKMILIWVLDSALRIVDDATDVFLRAAAAAAAAATAAAKRFGSMYRSSRNISEFCSRAAKSVSNTASGAAHALLQSSFFSITKNFRASPAAAAKVAAKAAAAVMAVAIVITITLYEMMFVVVPPHAVIFLLNNPGVVFKHSFTTLNP